MHPVDRNFQARLLKKISEEATNQVERLADGSAIDHADYRWRCGYIKALDHVREMCRDIARDENQSEPLA